MNNLMDSGAQVSVVMCVYNGLPGLPKTLESVLSQDGVDLEFIVVNDGSTDGSLAVLQEYAAHDERMRILDQKHYGLTQSLIRGCADAKGVFIARQDAGDVSWPGRLEKELAMFFANPNLALVSCGARFVGPGGEFLYEVKKTSNEADEALRSPDLATLRGPSHHGCTMFRREHYLRAGGYRRQFEVAQDLDLWTRLVELGQHEVVQEVLYQVILAPGAISGEKRLQQEATTIVIAECMRDRMATGDDSEHLKQAARIIGKKTRFIRRKSDANFYYFLASCLRGKNPRRSRHYLMAALKRNPFHLKALVRAIQAQIGAY
jgi:glycosyltransferase involved in cell wall biosynthesis